MKRAERRQLGAIIDEVSGWITAAAQARHLADHLPLSGAIGLQPGEAALAAPLDQAAASGDLAEAARLTHTAWFPGRKTLDPARAAADRLTSFHQAYLSTSSSVRLLGLRDGLAARAADERDRLGELLRALDRSAGVAQQLLHDAAHLPITRSGATSEEEACAAEAMVQAVDQHRETAGLLLEDKACAERSCERAHEAARVLADVHAEAQQAGVFDLLDVAASRVGAQLAAERDRVPAVLADLEGWRGEARQLLTDAKHLPLTRSGALSDEEAELVGRLVAAYDANIRAARKFQPSLCDTGACTDVHPPLAALAAHHGSSSTGDAHAIGGLARRLAGQAAAERDQLRDTLKELQVWQKAAIRGLEEAAHMPLTRTGVLTEAEDAAMRQIAALVGEHAEPASVVVDPASCAADACKGRHSSAVTLARFHAEATSRGTGALVWAAAERVTGQLHAEQQRIADLFHRASTWMGRCEEIRQTRQAAAQFVDTRLATLLKRSTAAKVDGTRIRLLPLAGEDDAQLVASLALLRDHPLTEDEQAFLDHTAATATALLATRTAFTSRWKCRSGGKCAHAHDLIPDLYARADAIEAELDRLTVDPADQPTDLDLLGDPTLGVADRLPAEFSHPDLVDTSTTERARGHLPAIVDAATIAKEAAERARAAANEVRAADVTRALKAMDLEALKKAAPEERLRVGPLQDYNLHSVWDVYEFQEVYDLASLTGLGDTTAWTITQATLRLHDAVREETPVRIDIKRKTQRTARLLESLRAWDAARRFEPTPPEVAAARGLATVTEKHPNLKAVLAVAATPAPAPPSVAGLLTAALDRIAPPLADHDIWTDFLSRPADYFSMLTELGFMTEDEKKMHGDLPDEIVEAVRAKELRRDHLTASLRTYQSFGARFVLAQEKVVIGDEMGLGKTVEALAVLAHLRATGDTHFLVVCPAAVVSNWIRETAKHTTLRAARLHGPVWERNHAAKSWLRQGGVAVTTYDLLPWAQDYLDQADLGCAVFDEAHYIKNPMAKRSLAAQDVIDSTRYAILMTGTPLENRVQEFRNLIAYLRPDLAHTAPEYLPSKFRKHVAPAYLRRNQEDVLTELPEMVEVEEWMGMSAADHRAYRAAVHDGQFMMMRRAALLSEDSMKVDRLVEIVAEAEANDRRVIVFSYFRDVLDRLAETLPGRVFGPLTGSLPAVERQRLVDRFSEAPGGAVLVSQITAGGVGLNIQSASVVVICEPQLKPTMEAQAIARAHRMGQVNTVQVHRLLTEDSVDERIREILEEKRQLFDEFARDSVIASQAPDALDVSDAELARIVVAAERERLFGTLEDPAGEPAEVDG